MVRCNSNYEGDGDASDGSGDDEMKMMVVVRFT